MKATKLSIWFSLLTILISCSNWNSTTYENEKLKERINEEIKDSLRIDSIHKATLNATKMNSILETSGKYLLDVSDLLNIYSVKDLDNKKILTTLRKYNSKWNLSNTEERSKENFYFIYSLIDNDIDKTGVINLDYQTNVLEYIFFDNSHIHKIITEVNDRNFEVYSVKKINNGDVTSYVSPNYNLSIKITDTKTPGVQNCSIYISRK